MPPTLEGAQDGAADELFGAAGAEPGVVATGRGGASGNALQGRMGRGGLRSSGLRGGTASWHSLQGWLGRKWLGLGLRLLWWDGARSDGEALGDGLRRAWPGRGALEGLRGRGRGEGMGS